MATTSSLSQAATDRPGSARYAELLLLLGLNVVPLFGVLLWDWRSVDVIFLYWLENVVIGCFVLARMLVRPYSGTIELVLPLLLGGFFLMHYGMFCYGHGSLVIGLFEPSVGVAGFGTQDLFATTTAMLSRPQILLAFAALALLQLFEWLKDIRQHGLGAESPFVLMMQPYRRILVLHVTILGGGFLLLALDEPLAGLVLLVLVKILADCRLWLRGPVAPGAEVGEPDEKQLKWLAEEFAEPKVVVNGETRYFDSFAELKDSQEYQRMLALFKMVGASSRLRTVEAYLDQKIAAEQAAAGVTDDSSGSE